MFVSGSIWIFVWFILFDKIIWSVFWYPEIQNIAFPLISEIEFESEWLKLFDEAELRLPRYSESVDVDWKNGDCKKIISNEKLKIILMKPAG